MFLSSKEKIEELPDEKAKAKAAKKELKKKKASSTAASSMEDLQNMILSKRNNAEAGFLKYMENKFCQEGDDSDIAFQTKNTKK